MRKIYISFLGLGGIGKGYSPALYDIDGTTASKPYEFVQCAEMEIIGGGYFDRVFIIVTPQSFEAHFGKMEKEMLSLGVKEVLPIHIEDDLSPKSQWHWFEQVLSCIDHCDELTIDLTHGYRIAPIVISTAVNFLQKSRNITLRHVWYGAYDKDREKSPVIDMKDFYVINEWADAVSRLVEDADVRKLADVAGSGSAPDFQIGNLGNVKMIKAFEDLTEAVRNVEIHKVGEKASTALSLIQEQRKKANITGKILLDLVTDKFATLAAGEPASGKYDLSYFKLQLEIIRILIEHKLFMQAYTVMRELIGSVGLITLENANILNKEGRKMRRKAELFINMLQIEEVKWDFGKAVQEVETLMSYYNHLKNIGVEPMLRGFCAELVQYRNGFDHAWTGKAQAFTDIKKKADGFFSKLDGVIRILSAEGVLV